jgi:CBS domain-containing protein
MQKRNIRRVPVVDDGGDLHGIVTFDDLFRHLTYEADALSDTVLSQSIGMHTTP